MHLLSVSDGTLITPTSCNQYSGHPGSYLFRHTRILDVWAPNSCLWASSEKWIPWSSSWEWRVMSVKEEDRGTAVRRDPRIHPYSKTERFLTDTLVLIGKKTAVYQWQASKFPVEKCPPDTCSTNKLRTAYFHEISRTQHLQANKGDTFQLIDLTAKEASGIHTLTIWKTSQFHHARVGIHPIRVHFDTSSNVIQYSDRRAKS